MISEHSDICAVERSFKKDWNSETWPNHLASQLQECKSSRKRESHLGKNAKGTRPVRLRSLVPELFETPLDEDVSDSKSQVDDGLSSDVAATVLSDDSSYEDFTEESSEGSPIGDSCVSSVVSTNLCIVPEEISETYTVVPTPSSKKASDIVQSCYWNRTPKTTSLDRPSAQTLNRSRFAEELQKLDLSLNSKLPQSGGTISNMPDFLKINGYESSLNNLHSKKPLSFKEPKPKGSVLENSGNKNRPVLKDIGCSPLVNSLQPKLDRNGRFESSENKENMYYNFSEKVSTRFSGNVNITPNNISQEKLFSSKTVLKNEDISKINYNYKMPIGQNLETFFDSSQGHILSSHIGVDLSSGRVSDCIYKENIGDFTNVCKKCLRKTATEEKGVQCEPENSVCEIKTCELIDKEVQCSTEKVNKCVSADWRLRSDETTERTLVVKGKRYNVLCKLGSGGSSVVYQVLDPNTSSIFAVKCVRLPVEQEATARGYINEIKLLQKLQDSDCVITLHDFEHIPKKEILYVVMEKGDTDLSKLIRDSSNKRRNLSTPLIVYYWTEMLNAVKCIHDHGVIHSDLKPANFLLVSGRLKLIDFGISSSVQSDMTSVFKDSLTGTLNYMSPETVTCCNSSPMSSKKYRVSYRSDVWSLGCILYSLIYGHTPFQHIDNMYMKIAAITDPSSQISYPEDNRCPQILIETLKRCLVYDPKMRPTIAELLAVPYISG